MGSTLGWQIDPQLSFDSIWSTDRLLPPATSLSSRPSVLPLHNYSPPAHHLPYSYEVPAAAGVTQAALHSAHTVNYIAVNRPIPQFVDEHLGAATQPVVARFHHGAERGKYFGCQWGASQPCGTVVEATVTALVSHLETVHGVYVRAKEETGHLLDHQGTTWAEENAGPVAHAHGELREGALNQYSFVDTQDENPPAVLTSNNPINLLRRDATPPNVNLVPGSESTFTCRWAERGTICTDRVNAEGIVPHLERKHGVTSGSQAYYCLWDQCSTTQSMLKSSLIRHVKEKHALLKSVCPTCDKMFTRRETLMSHWKRRHRLHRTQVGIERLRSGFAPVASSSSLLRAHLPLLPSSSLLRDTS